MSDLTADIEIHALEQQAGRALSAGNVQEAMAAWGRVLALNPNHVRTLTAIGQHAFRQGNLPAAKAACQRVVDVDGKDPQQWVNLALVCQGLKDEPGEEAALRAALRADPSDLLALILQGNLLERQGKRHEAARTYGAAATVSPPIERLAPELRPSVMHAMAFREQYDTDCGRFMDEFLAPHYADVQGENVKRFRDSLDILVGRKRRFDSLSMMHHYPGLPAIEFFDRALFPWLDAFEDQTAAIRDEFQAVLERDQGFAPYIGYPEGVPLNQWAELNHSLKWSAFHLYKKGEVVAENAAQCPLTMSLLRDAPQPAQPGRTPAAMFSLLKPRTRIPPHTGVSNVRLVTHVPLIVPAHCGFRVGNETRQWVPGKAWVFDDTIEHEAWNDSDALRVVLIFDIWHPMLSAAERRLIAAMAEGLNQFTGSDGGFEL